MSVFMKVLIASWGEQTDRLRVVERGVEQQRHAADDAGTESVVAFAVLHFHVHQFAHRLVAKGRQQTAISQRPRPPFHPPLEQSEDPAVGI